MRHGFHSIPMIECVGIRNERLAVILFYLINYFPYENRRNKSGVASLSKMKLYSYQTVLLNSGFDVGSFQQEIKLIKKITFIARPHISKKHFTLHKTPKCI